MRTEGPKISKNGWCHSWTAPYHNMISFFLLFFQSKEEEYLHEKESHSNDLHCQKCQITSTTLKSFNDHLPLCLEDPKNFICKKCNNNYIWHSAICLQLHWAEEHKLHRPICEICGKALTHKHELKLHMKTHNNSHLHQCHYCGKSK